jgi:hypothetical protein
MQPEYMMASTPHDFVLKEGTFATTVSTGVNQDAIESLAHSMTLLGATQPVLVRRTIHPVSLMNRATF